MCIDIPQVLKEFLKNVGAQDQYKVIVSKADIKGPECWTDPSAALSRITANNLLETVLAKKINLRKIFATLDEQKIHLSRPASLMQNDTKEIKTTTTPVVRQGLFVSFENNCTLM